MNQQVLGPAIVDNPKMWFQQDGATAQTAQATMRLSSKIFGEDITPRNSALNWPFRSPDLTALDHFYW